MLDGVNNTSGSTRGSRPTPLPQGGPPGEKSPARGRSVAAARLPGPRTWARTGSWPRPAPAEARPKVTRPSYLSDCGPRPATLEPRGLYPREHGRPPGVKIFSGQRPAPLPAARRRRGGGHRSPALPRRPLRAAHAPGYPALAPSKLEMLPSPLSVLPPATLQSPSRSLNLRRAPARTFPTPTQVSPPSVGGPRARSNGQIKAARAYAQ